MSKINKITINQALKFAISKFITSQIKNPLFEAELLLSFILKKSREFILTYPETKISIKKFENFKIAVRQRARNIPFAYICGYKYFYGLKFIVDKNVLVPRPETEMIVEEVLDHITHSTQHTTIVDIGTGSGCIVISIAKELHNKNITFNSYAIDISSSTLLIAKKNAKLNHVNKFIKFYQGNLLDPILKKITKSDIIITANLPYLTPVQIKNSPSIQKEPRLALVAGADGLKYYRALFKQIRSIGNDLQSASLFLEIDHTQRSGIAKLIKQELPQAEFEIKKDLGGHFRLVKILIGNQKDTR